MHILKKCLDNLKVTKRKKVDSEIAVTSPSSSRHFSVSPPLSPSPCPSVSPFLERPSDYTKPPTFFNKSTFDFSLPAVSAATNSSRGRPKKVSGIKESIVKKKPGRPKKGETDTPGPLDRFIFVSQNIAADPEITSSSPKDS